MRTVKENTGYIAIALVSVISVTGVFLLDPIPQDLKYHLFSDQKTIFGVPNFWNVLSNLPFLLVGLTGLHSILRSKKCNLLADMKATYLLFFIGVSLVAFGSGYYHLWPSNTSLVWDRLPMTVAFMALFSLIISEFTSPRLGKLSLWPLIVFGVSSVLYWHVTESNGEGDLRFYVLVQFLPMLVIPLILVLFKSTFTNVRGYWYLLCAYALAKAFEHFDQVIHNSLVFLSGHSVKHVIAALGVLLLLNTYNTRKIIA